MFFDVFRCFSMFGDVFRCLTDFESMFYGLWGRCLTDFWVDVFRCFSMFGDVFRCLTDFGVDVWRTLGAIFRGVVTTAAELQL